MKKIIIVALFAVTFISTANAARHYVRNERTGGMRNTMVYSAGVQVINYDLDINSNCQIYMETESYYNGVSVELQVEYSGGNQHGGARPYVYSWLNNTWGGDFWEWHRRTQYVEKLDWVKITTTNSNNIYDSWGIGAYAYSLVWYN